MYKNPIQPYLIHKLLNIKAVWSEVQNYIWVYVLYD